MYHALQSGFLPFLLAMLYGCGCIGYMFFLIARGKGYKCLQWTEGRRMQFRSSKIQGLVGFLSLSAFGVFFLSFASLHPYPLVLYTLCAGINLCGLYVSGRTETVIDGEKRIYQRTEGFPWRPKTRTGSLDDIAGVYVSSEKAVSLVFKHGEWWTGMVVDTSDCRTANAMASKISDTVGLPIVKRLP